MSIKSISYIFLFFGAFLCAQEDVRVLAELPTEISETSGLIFYRDKLITHNDSGNTPQLYEIDTTTYQITRTVTVTNVENIDWEDLAQDEEYIYIGDFGNNVGIRTDLKIYRVAKQEYDESDTVTAEQINFSYEDQTDFTNNGNSDWDAEAFFVLDDQLIILTKQWQSNGTVAYALPKIPGTYEADRIDTFAIEGLVTGATYNPLTDVLFIVGYSSTLSPFTAQLTGVTSTVIFNSTIIRANLSIGFAQVESIAYADETTYFLTSESFMRTTPNINLVATLFKFDSESNSEPEPEPEPESEFESGEETIIVFKGRLFNFLEYQSSINKPIIKRSIFDTLGREITSVLGEDIQDNRVDLSALQNGIYYLTFYFSDDTVAIPFYKD